MMSHYCDIVVVEKRDSLIIAEGFNLFHDKDRDDILSESKTAVGYNSNRPSPWACVLIGVPSDVGILILEEFIEPYRHDVIEYYFIQTLSHGRHCILHFKRQESLLSFCSLYNNLRYPSNGNAPSCLVFSLSSVILREKPRELGMLKYAGDMGVQNTNLRLGQFLPACPVCLRRLRPGASGIQETADSLLTNIFKGPGSEGCKACAAFSVTPNVLTSNKSTHLFEGSENAPDGTSTDTEAYIKSLRCCYTCSLEENIWVCLICGHAGCGRYTSQHAKTHFDRSGHGLAMELASGRIWDYDTDLFVHNEADPWCTQRQHNEKINNDEISTSDIPPEQEKFRHLLTHYEGLLETQMAEQQMYFEKLLARETIRALELSLKEAGGGARGADAVSVSAALVATSSAKSDSSSANSSQKVQHKLDTKARTHSTSSSLTGSQLSDDMSDAEAGGITITEDDLNCIAVAKTELSLLEWEHANIQRQVASFEGRVRVARRENETLLREQHLLRARVADAAVQAESVREQGEQAVRELEQEIRDLSFYVCARSRVGASPMRDELSTGTLVLPSSPPLPLSSTASVEGTPERSITGKSSGGKKKRGGCVGGTNGGSGVRK